MIMLWTGLIKPVRAKCLQGLKKEQMLDTKGRRHVDSLKLEKSLA